MRYDLVGDLVRTVSRFAIVGALGVLAAGCSADAMRFSETPFANPFSNSAESEPPMTGSVDGPAPSARLPRGSVQSSALPPVAGRGASAPARPAPVRSAAAAPAGLNPGLPQPAASRSGWSTEGGTLVTIAPGDSAASLASRYGVPASAILSANTMAARDVTPGRRIVIPVYRVMSANGRTTAVASRTAEPEPARPVARQPVLAFRPGPPPAAPAPVVHVRPGQVASATKPAAAPLRPARKEIARAEPAEPRTTGSVEPKAAHPRPGRVPAAEAAVQPPAKPVAKAPEPKAAEKAATGKVVKSEPIPVAPAKPAKLAASAQPLKEAKPEAKNVVTLEHKSPADPAKMAARTLAKAPEPAKQPEPAKAPAKEVESTASLQPSADFRWPARGRVITGFGGSSNSEGINIAVPDGTPVKAAESGTVAYAGSEVKGYGNLVLIRHDNGYVSAYAHNGELDVKRGQKVSRGQTIAKSGQTGNVTSPQIHFEIRKGSTPVDPMPYLSAAN